MTHDANADLSEHPKKYALTWTWVKPNAIDWRCTCGKGGRLYTTTTEKFIDHESIRLTLEWEGTCYKAKSERLVGYP